MISTFPTTSVPHSSALAPTPAPESPWVAHGAAGYGDEALMMLLVFGGFGAYLWWVRRAFKQRHQRSQAMRARPESTDETESPRERL